MKRTRRNLILKFRQGGLSKIIDADQTVDCLRKPTNAVIISHEKEATKRLFASVRAFAENMEPKPTISINSKTEIGFPRTNSSYFVGTAGSKAFGRGDTIDRAHLSEAAFYAELERILNGIEEATEFGQIDVETTPNGRGEFYDRWQKAKAGLSSYTPIFIPWFMNDEFDVTHFNEKERAGLSVSVQEMVKMSDEDFNKIITEEEKRLLKRAKEEWDIDVTVGMLKWRRYKIWDKGQNFYQEYPEDDVSCFLKTGRTVFSGVILDTSRKIRLDDFDAWCIRNKWDNEKKIAFKKKRLYGAVDCAEGNEGGDNHCFSVIDSDMDTGKSAVIFEITCTDPIDVFWSRVAKICKEFNILLAIEKNGLGVAHIQKAKELHVKHREWNTGENRNIMISNLEEMYRKGDLIESYPEAQDELINMIYNDNNKAEAPKGKHDDRVLSRSIAWQMKKMPVPGVSWV